MTLNRNRLYVAIFTACSAGYTWLYLQHSNTFSASSLSACPIKHLTGIPCPSCGSTRAIIVLTKGDFKEAFLLNPISYLVASIMIITPIWIIFDVTTKQNTLFDFYHKVEKTLQKPKYAIPLIILVLINWFWNYHKNL